jgi:hypothetical protein
MQSREEVMHRVLRSNRSFDADTHRQGAARRAGELARRGALPMRAGQLRRQSGIVLVIVGFLD